MIGGSIILKKVLATSSPAEARKGAKRIAVANFQSSFIKYSLKVWT